jgi:hypothetical protein
MQIEVLGTSKDGVNGWVTLMVRVIGDDGGVGMAEKVMGSPEEIGANFAGDVAKWLTTVHGPGLRQRHVARTTTHTSLHGLRGQRLSLEL